MSSARKVILISESGQSIDRMEVVRELFDRRIELLCARGDDSEEWESCMEWLCVMAGVEEGIDHLVLTTASGSDVPIEVVISLAEQINIPSGSEEIEIIRV